MSLILNIETSTSVCSVALSEGEEVVFEKASFEGPSHAALLGVYMEEALEVAKSKGMKLDAVAVSSGPGSYTGYGIPLIGIHTLDILASAAIRKNKEEADCLYCAMLDARRMEVYSSIYDSHLNTIRATTADIVDADSYASFLENGKVCFFGDGAAKCETVITSPNACFIDGIYPLAVNMASLSQKAYDDARFENVAYFEPFYLKEFQATIAKNKVLNEALGKNK